ncbi:MAG: hypothetical protein ACE5E3_04475, partial [Mariprofundus sp.]
EAGDAVSLPVLPEGAAVGAVILPVEQLLCRRFALPLSNPRHVDQEILAQELEEHTAEDAENWWLVWQANSCVDGVSGIMFGLPESLRQQIEENSVWSQANSVSVDIWPRLQAQMERAVFAHASSDGIAVFDADQSGICFGLWFTPAHGGQGFWQGMRRLNWGEGALSEQQAKTLAIDIKRSLQAMGWQDGAAIGALPVELEEAMAFSGWQGDLLECADLPSRHETHFASSTVSPLNFRHGRWRAGSDLARIKPWYRSMALAAGLALAWMLGAAWQNHQLQGELDVAQQRVIDAFHQGLPDETVIIDALAQLKKAAGGSAGVSGNQAETVLWLQTIMRVNAVYKATPWQIKEMSFHDGAMSMSGQTVDLATMNKIQQALEKQTGKAVKIEDTDLSGKQIKFRMVWS